MIRVTCFGHVRRSLGRDTVDLPGEGLRTGELIERLRAMCGDDPNLGFNRFNTLVIVNGLSAFGASDDRTLHDGDEVVLLPFSHGG